MAATPSQPAWWWRCTSPVNSENIQQVIIKGLQQYSEFPQKVLGEIPNLLLHLQAGI